MGLSPSTPPYTSQRKWCVGEEKQNPTRLCSIYDGVKQLSNKVLLDYAFETAARYSQLWFQLSRLKKTPYESYGSLRQALSWSYLKSSGVVRHLLIARILTKPDKL
ncbi:hypothetical protein Tco_1467880 [Tanacetum coccineum]